MEKPIMPQPTAPTKIKLDDLTLDPRLQPRVNGLIEKAWHEYAEAMRRGDTLPPLRVVVGKENDQDTLHHWLTQGWHRVTAARSLGLTELDAFVRAGTFADAEDEMLKSNYEHGERRTTEDLQNAIRRALLTKRWQRRSDNWIADHLHCSDKTVTTMRGEMELTSEIPKLTRLRGKDGKDRTRRAPKESPVPQPTSTIEDTNTIESTPIPLT